MPPSRSSSSSLYHSQTHPSPYDNRRTHLPLSLPNTVNPKYPPSTPQSAPAPPPSQYRSYPFNNDSACSAPSQIPLRSHRSSTRPQPRLTFNSTSSHISPHLPVDASLSISLRSRRQISHTRSPAISQTRAIETYVNEYHEIDPDKSSTSSRTPAEPIRRDSALLTLQKAINDPAYLIPQLAVPQISVSQPAMVFQSHVNYLSAKLEVTFENNGVVDMLSGPNTGSSYSLPGHVIISVPSLPAPFEGRLREVRDLKVVMEGKSEFWDDHGRYTPLRLYTATVTLATPSNPLLVPSHDPSRPQSARIKLAVAFDMRLPGWLPPSHSSEMTNVSYGVLASSTIGWTEMVSTLSAPSSSSSRLSSTDGDVSMDSIIPFRHNFKPKSKNSFESFFTNNSLLPKTTDRSTGKWTPFTILRHRLPTSIGGFAQERSERHYTLRPEADSTSPVECVVTVPDWVDVNGEEKSLKVSLRVRARKHAIKSQVDEESSLASSTTTTTGQSQPAAASNAPGTGTYGVMEDNHQELDAIPMERQTKGKKADDELLTHILELGMEVEEVERYSSTPTTSFTSSFPLPAEQPSRHSSHHQLISPRSSYADGGFLGYDERPFRGIRTRQCLLSEDGNQRNFFFADNGLGLGEKWRKVNVVLPMPADIGKGLSSRPQPEMDGPFLKIKHSLKIRVVCRNIDGGKEDTQVVILSTPIRFGTCPSTMPSSSTKAPSLPAYIQLFHENGDLRECDALPVYSKSEDGSDEISDRPPVQAPIPSEPAPSYNSLFSSSAPSSATSYGCSSRSPSPSGSSYLSERSLSSSSLGRRERSSSPLPSSDEEPMDVDGALSSDEETRIGRNAVPSQTARKVARTVPRIVRTAA